MENSNSPQLLITDIEVAYSGQPVLHQISFGLQRGQIGCLLGPSGCGKTTLLRALAGFEPIRAGSIHIHGVKVATAVSHLPPEKRRIGMVFQDYALFPHLTVAQNIAFGLRGSRAKKQERVQRMLTLVDLLAYGSKYPHELSGGQQQRVALARALAPQPEILLLDEPFSNLDPALREKLALDVRAILKQEHTTAMLVTHDQQEAFALADSIGILSQGKLQQWGSAHAIYNTPQNAFVAEFIGQGVLLEGRWLADGQIHCEIGSVTASQGASAAAGTPARVLLRPDYLALDADGPIQATIGGRTFRGSSLLYLLILPSGQQVPVLADHDTAHDLGDTVRLRLVQTQTMVYPAH